MERKSEVRMFVGVAATAPFPLFRGGGVADVISHVLDLGDLLPA